MGLYLGDTSLIEGGGIKVFTLTSLTDLEAGQAIVDYVSGGGYPILAMTETDPYLYVGYYIPSSRTNSNISFVQCGLDYGSSAEHGSLLIERKINIMAPQGTVTQITENKREYYVNGYS